MKCIFAPLLLLAAALAACDGASAPAAPEPAFYERISSAEKIVLASMAVTKTASISDANRGDDASLIDRMKIGSRVAAYSYDTYLRAFIDLSELSPADIAVDHAARTVSVTLPPIRTEVAGRDATLREEHYRVTGLRSEIDARERARLKEQMNASLMAEVDSDPRFRRMLEATARDKAAAFVGALVAAEGYTPVITFSRSAGLTDN